jgi:hypothetical protein
VEESVLRVTEGLEFRQWEKRPSCLASAKGHKKLGSEIDSSRQDTSLFFFGKMVTRGTGVGSPSRGPDKDDGDASILFVAIHDPRRLVGPRSFFSSYIQRLTVRHKG